MKQYHTIKQVAEALNVSDKTVRRMVKRGTLRAYKVGPQIRIDGDDLAAYMDRAILQPKRKGKK